MTNIYILLGSNIGNRILNIESSIKEIEIHIGSIQKRSKIYETEPWGEKDQDDFLNIAIEVSTKYKPLEVLEKIKIIENKIGRLETYKWGPREIDIDILFFGDLMMMEEKLSIPHPFLHERKFTLVPLAEIGADLFHPFLGQTIKEILIDMDDDSMVKIYNKL